MQDAITRLQLCKREEVLLWSDQSFVRVVCVKRKILNGPLPFFVQLLTSVFTGVFLKCETFTTIFFCTNGAFEGGAAAIRCALEKGP